MATEKSAEVAVPILTWMKRMYKDQITLSPTQAMQAEIRDLRAALASRSQPQGEPVATDRRRCKPCGATRGGDACWKCGAETFEPDPRCGDDPALPPIDRIRELAKEVGYAIGVHGSQQRDFDIIAAPWTDSAIGNHALLQHIAAGLITDNGPAKIISTERKPLGRYAATIQMDGWYKQLDISVCPNEQYEYVNHAAQVAQEGAKKGCESPAAEVGASALRAESAGQQKVKCPTCEGKGGWVTDSWIDPVSGPECEGERCGDCDGTGFEVGTTAEASEDARDAARLAKLLMTCADAKMKFGVKNEIRQLTMTFRVSDRTSEGFRAKLRKTIDEFEPVAVLQSAAISAMAPQDSAKMDVL